MSTSFAPTQAELALVNQIFAQGDPQKLGILTGDVAVRIFTGAKLPPATLGEIWGLADEDNNGWLSRKSCAQAVRLMGWAQKGEKVNKDLVNKPGPVPVIDGVSSVTTHNTGMSIPRSPPPMPNLPSLTPQDKAKFHNMFVKANPTNGLLTGEQARDIFVKSKLPNDKLLQIWNLADTQDRGALDASDFAIGMYFIQGVMSNQISVLPQTLPPSLYQQAAGGNRPYIQPQYTGQSQMLQPQSTGMAQSRPPKPPAPSLPARPAAANPSKIGSSVFGINGVVKWDVTAAEKAQSDGYFDKLDANGVGYIEGDVAVPFMLESKLPGDVLAQVWDLSDLNNDGRLTRDGFAVAMHLISKKLAGNEVPSTLPPTLIPPSMRANGAAAASPFQPVQQQPQEPTRDLFSFDETPPTSAVSPAFSHTPMQPQATGSHLTSPMPAQDPFGASTPTRNLMDDDDEQTISPPIQDQSAEIGNIQNQLNSTNRSLDATKSERQATEQNLASQAAQLSSLQTQLSSAKAAYETETKLLSALKERFANQGAEIQKTREELIRSESDLSAVRVEKAEIEGAFLRDKEEARELHRKMVEAGQQAETLKAEVEKVKKDAKQQKGLLAIARKQLSSKEAEK
ncbi:EF-hand, partial [Dendrothele bispora CBS 962.96]